MGASPVCAAFTTYEGAVSNCINAAMHARESEKDRVFFHECVEQMKQAKEALKKVYKASTKAR